MVKSWYFQIMYSFPENFILPNSVDPDKMSHFVAFHKGCHCLPNYLYESVEMRDVFCGFFALLTGLWIRVCISCWYSKESSQREREHSGSVVECLTRDWEAAGSNLTGRTALCPWARYIATCLVLVKPRLDWKTVDWDIKNQIKQTNHLNG